ncbi:hypothetical protein [Hydrogenophaga sp. 2FB]|uniref:hypothetical protein n=1 Tax=Hydrogenophaga sp. 2FB TaxID=2502187 RepID=UPI0010F76CBB|nr:hypothetical protein [Hydrogenophaga sp. 2FB]
MLNISSTTAVSWPTPVSTAVAPVSPAAAVQPVQAGGHDGKAQTGFGREDRATPQPPTTPRRAEDGRTPPATSTTAKTATEPGAAAPRDLAARQQARQEAADAAEQQQAKGKRTVEHLQQVLSNMWEASAAVVDRALGIEPSNSDALGNQSDTAPDLSAVAASLIPRKPLVPQRAGTAVLEHTPHPEMQRAAGGDAAVDVMGDGVSAEDSTPADIVSYDEHGHGSAAPLEVGSLVSERV